MRRKIQSLQGIFGFSHVSTGTTSITATIFKLFCSLKSAEKEKASVFRGKVENTDVFALRASDFVLYINFLYIYVFMSFFFLKETELKRSNKPAV